MVEMGAENIPEGGEVGPEGGGWTGNRCPPRAL